VAFVTNEQMTRPWHLVLLDLFTSLAAAAFQALEPNRMFRLVIEHIDAAIVDNLYVIRYDCERGKWDVRCMLIICDVFWATSA